MRKIWKSKVILWIMLLGSMLPIIVISFYNRQNADDFVYTELTHRAVIEGKSVLLAAIDAVKYFMTNWNGLYFSSFLQSLSFGIYGAKFCFLNTIVILVSLILGCSILSWTVIRSVAKDNESDWKLLAGLILIYIVQTLPNPVQGLYWYNGAVNYTFMWALFLILLSLMLQYVFGENTKYAYCIYAFGLILTVLTVGGNHVVQGLALGFSGLISLYCLKKKTKREIIVFFILSLIGFVINMTSGGGQIRWQSMEYDHNILKTIITSTATTVQYGIQWFTFSLVLLIISSLILIKSIIKKISNQYNIRFIFVLFTFLFTVVIIFCMNFIPTYAMGYAGSGRVTNIVYASYVILTIGNAFLLACYVEQKFHVFMLVDKFSDEQKNDVSTISSIILIISICYMAVFGMGTCIRVPYGSTAINAVKDLASGAAKEYATELDEREVYYSQHQGEDIVVNALSCYPYILCFTDIELNANDYKNSSQSIYYGINSLTRTPDSYGK